MKKNMIRISVCLATLALVVLLGRMPPIQNAEANRVTPSVAEASHGQIALACPGRIEGKSETISVGAAIDGVIQTISVREGQEVSKGETLAVIGCSDLQSSREVARAEADS